MIDVFDELPSFLCALLNRNVHQHLAIQKGPRGITTQGSTAPGFVMATVEISRHLRDNSTERWALEAPIV